MYISEGVLNAPVLIGSGIAAAAFTIVGLKKMRFERIMNVALLTSAFFIASLIHVPVGPGSIHLVLNGLLGIILGWACFPAIITALLLQALFFQFGGFTVLGVNTIIMALPALLSYYLVRPWLKNGNKKRAIAAFLGGFFAIFFSSVLMALALITADKGFFDTALLIFTTQLPLMVVEGFITMFAVMFLAKVQPDFLYSDIP
jgi:cobalt/nickel transport system permease protein